MKAHKKIPLFNFLLFGSFALLGVGVFLYTLLSKQPLPAIIVTGAVGAAGMTIEAILLLKWYNHLPDYRTRQGVSVWTGDSSIPRQLMEEALDFFLYEMTKRGYSADRMLQGTCVEWSRKRISRIGLGWSAKDKAGLQSGKHILVQWTGAIHKSALFHELRHEFDEIVLRAPTDYKHENVDAWKENREITEAYGKVEG